MVALKKHGKGGRRKLCKLKFSHFIATGTRLSPFQANKQIKKEIIPKDAHVGSLFKLNNSSPF